jgi:tryptophanyl-tRNA synthetase
MLQNNEKLVLLSGIQPTGNLTIGNYIGALNSWVNLQETHDCLFMLADLHAFTTRQDPAVLFRRCVEFTALYLACGIDPVKNTIFIQSHVPTHTQLLWILNCLAHMGDLRRMTQFKDKANEISGNVSVGLFDYPVLMAADILLYETDIVPVGDDQIQHLEFTRNIARRANHFFGEVFKLPKPYIPETGARLMALQNPGSKMSKSDENPNNYIALLDPPDSIRKKIKQAITDSGNEIRFDPSKPGISNLMTIYASMTGESMESIQSKNEGIGYADFKKTLTEIIIEFLTPIQKRYRSISSDPGELLSTLNRGSKQAHERSQQMLNRVHHAIGFVPNDENLINEATIRKAI